MTTETRRLAAIMFTDMVGFSRQMGSNEARMLRLLDVHNHLIQQAVAEHHGTVIKTVGDAFLVDFPSVVHAVQCAQQIQGQFRAHNTEKPADEQIHVRIGIHLGDVVQRDGDVFGDGVNIASRLQTLAEPDMICLSDVVYRDVTKKLDLGTVVSLGRPQLKNIVERFQVYALLLQPAKGLWQTLQIPRLKLSRRVGTTHLIGLVAVLGLVAGTVVALRSSAWFSPNPQPLTPGTQGLALPDKPSIVVLPFVNMSEDHNQEYFSDGMTEDLITDLSKVSGLFVIARNSAFTYKGKALKVEAVGRELGVRYVLEGSVRKVDDKVRITAQLVDATTGDHLWAERYDRPLKDIFTLQDEIRQKITMALRVKLTQEEQERFKSAPTDNLEAYDYFLQGLNRYQHLTKEANVQARQMFEKAIELDPQYAAAYAELGWTYVSEWFAQWSQDPQAPEQAFALAQKAAALDDASPRAHMLLGWFSLFKKQYEQAIAEVGRAIALDPNLAVAYARMGFILNFAGRPQEAIGFVEKALRLDPISPFFALSALGQAYRLLGRYEEAIATFKRVLALNPDLWIAHAQLTLCYSELGREEEARTQAAELLRVSPHFSVEVMKQRLPVQDPVEFERYLAALRKAGLK
ncbi:MAG: adenylate/guanylate cyclase domain-containing protein [Deltaproteobacteria bacterium]|nr:adenylate/guanylate cyclase domain-containing protein [Deltaproteobacteria bacterium]